MLLQNVNIQQEMLMFMQCLAISKLTLHTNIKMCFEAVFPNCVMVVTTMMMMVVVVAMMMVG